METKRKIYFFRNYFRDFFEAQTEKVKQKIDYVLFLVTVADKVPKKFFKKITGHEDIWEIRIQTQGNIYRIFCCFDEGNIIVLFNGFQKKSRKIPVKEIEKAEKLKKKYFKLKKEGKLL